MVEEKSDEKSKKKKKTSDYTEYGTLTPAELEQDKDT